MPAYLVRPEEEEQVVYLRVFHGRGGMVRLDVSTQNDDDHLQLIVGGADLMNRIGEPQRTS